MLTATNDQRGFTLIELIVAIAIVAILFGIVVTQSGNWFDANIKQTSNKISSTIRYLHDKASTENLYIRLVFDLGKNSYYVEATTERFMLASKEVQEVEAEEEEKEKAITKEEKGTVKEGEKPEETKGVETITEGTVEVVKKYRTPKFSAVDEFLLKPVVLPNGVFLKDVYTGHDKGPVSDGEAFIYFFPNGYIDPAIINLRDEKDEVHFSIEVNPIIGTTKIADEYKTMK